MPRWKIFELGDASSGGGGVPRANTNGLRLTGTCAQREFIGTTVAGKSRNWKIVTAKIHLIISSLT